MKAWQDNSGNLIVINVLMFVRALLVAFGVGMVAAWIAPIPSRQSLGWSAVCVLFVLALLTADERSTFVFERRTGILRWRQDTPFRHEAGEVPFAAITGLSVERDFRFRGASSESRDKLTTGHPVRKPAVCAVWLQTISRFGVSKFRRRVAAAFDLSTIIPGST
jgi:hypothetical protein